MPITIIQKGDPGTLDEVPRHYKPVEYREYDCSTMEAFALGLTVNPGGRHRVGVLYGISKTDDRMIHLAKYIGQATGQLAMSILLGAEDDWGHAQDIMEARVETVRRREVEAMMRKMALQTEINRQLPDIADDMEKKKKGLSSFGEYGFLQRVS